MLKSRCVMSAWRNWKVKKRQTNSNSSALPEEKWPQASRTGASVKRSQPMTACSRPSGGGRRRRARAIAAVAVAGVRNRGRAGPCARAPARGGRAGRPSVEGGSALAARAFGRVLEDGFLLPRQALHAVLADLVEDAV